VPAVVLRHLLPEERKVSGSGGIAERARQLGIERDRGDRETSSFRGPGRDQRHGRDEAYDTLRRREHGPSLDLPARGAYHQEWPPLQGEPAHVSVSRLPRARYERDRLLLVHHFLAHLGCGR